jgi:hypothetical protein
VPSYSRRSLNVVTAKGCYEKEAIVIGEVVGDHSGAMMETFD